MHNLAKFVKAVAILKPNLQFSAYQKIENEEDFKKVKWVTGEKDNVAIITTTCPHSEITWTAVKTEMDKL